MHWTPSEIDNLNCATSSERLGLMSLPRRRRKPGFAWSIARFVVGLFRALLWWGRRTRVTPAKFLAALESANQRRVFDAIGPWENLRTVAVAVTVEHSDLRLPLHKAYLRSLKWLPAIVRASRAAVGYKRLGWKYQAQEYALTPGYFEVARQFIAKVEPKLVIVANDHNMRLRAFVRAATDLGYRTVYIQHASVTERFPPLSTTFALLDGVDALKKYLSAGASATTTYLTGSPLHDGLIEAGHAAPSSQVVGLCLNLIDEVTVVQNLVDRLSESGAAKLLVRTHPRDTRPWRKLLSGIDVRSALDEPLTAYLSQVGVVLAGASNVHLEAAIFGRPSVLIDLSPSQEDHYGFVGSGIVSHCSADEVIDVIRSSLATGVSSHVRQHLKQFSATIGTSWEGRSGVLIRQLLDGLVEEDAGDALFPFSYEVGTMTIHTLSELTQAQVASLGYSKTGLLAK